MKDRDAFSDAKSSGGRVAFAFADVARGFRRRSAALGWRDNGFDSWVERKGDADAAVEAEGSSPSVMRCAAPRSRVFCARRCARSARDRSTNCVSE
jgi:hypothetical protein